MTNFNTCLWRFANFLAFHPFRDGNGRTARVLLLRDMSQLLNGAFVSAPIGAVIYAWQPIFIHTLRQIYTGSEEAWSNFVSLMVEIVCAAFVHSETLQKRRS